MTDRQGACAVLALPPGRYKIIATMTGFQQSIGNNVDLSVNDKLTFDLTLPVGSVQQNVSVEANALRMQTGARATGTTIESPQILGMPLTGRSYLDLLSLQAGVSPANTNSSYSDRGPASGLYSSTGNVSTDGQPEYANAFLVNGAEVNETKNMGAGLIPNADSVAEFRVLTNSFRAEYGKFTGAVMNTVTKSGTNHIHGDVFEFYRNQGMNANSWFSGGTKPQLKRHQFGGVVVGPIWKQRLFFFDDYQQTRQVAGASTGILQVLSNDERKGIFSDSTLNTPVQGGAWAQTLISPGAGTIVPRPTNYNHLGTAPHPPDLPRPTLPPHT